MQIIYGGKKKIADSREAFSSQKGSMSPKMKSIGPMKLKKALLTWDVFRGETTDHVAQILDSLNIKVVKVSANMTHFFQPLDLTVNGSTKNL